MIGIITSCINPKENSEKTKSYFSTKQREEQTIFTINKLRNYNFKQLFLVDNSHFYDFTKIQFEFPELKIIQLTQYQFPNKGINELLMLLSVIEYLPDNEQIFKISGRYYPMSNFNTEFNSQFDFRIKGYQFSSKRGTISTRGYFVRNKIIYESFLLKTLSEVFSYEQRIVGLRSFLKQVRQIFRKKNEANYNISIEFASARIIKNELYTYHLSEILGIQGEIAGHKGLTPIKE